MKDSFGSLILTAMNDQSTFAKHNLTDYINTTTIFGGIKRTIISKDFKGGKISNLFGSTEIDLSNADMTGIVVLDISQAFGEIKLAVPHDWHVETDLSHFCSVEEDFRPLGQRFEHHEKVLVLKGHSAFAVVELEN